MANNGESFLLYKTQCKSLLKLPDDRRGELLAHIIRYAFDGIRPDIEDLACDVLFDQISDQMDRDKDKYKRKCERNREIALAREEARKKKETNVNERARTFTNVTYTDTDTENDTDTDNENDTDNDTDAKRKEKKKPARHRYGEYDNVLLTDGELEKLRAEFPGDWQQKIDRLSEYMASKGKTYKSHLATIRAWAKKDGGKSVNADIDRKQRSEYRDEYAAALE